MREAIRREPSNASYLARLGSLLAAENKLEEAASYFEKSLKLKPSDLEVRRNLAVSYWQMGKLDKAGENLEFVLKAKPGDAWATLLLGLVSEDRGDARKAIRLLSSVPSLVRQRPEPVLALARAYYQEKEIDKARETLSYLNSFQGNPQVIFQGGRAASEFKDYETAERLLRSIRGSYPNAAELSLNLALAEYGAKKYAECQNTLLDSIGNGQGGAEAYSLLGWTYEKQDKMEESLKAFEKAINLDPAKQVYFLELGEALLEKKNFDAALAVAKEAIKRFPESSRAQSLKGSVELHMYLLNDAEASYRRAVHLDPSDSKAGLGLALTLWNANHDAEAAKILEEGAQRFSKDGLFLLKYAIFLLNSPQAGEAATEARIKELLKKSEELDDTNAETHFSLGNFAIKENRLEEALREFQAAEQLDPEMAKVHFALARVYRRMGREAEAIRETEVHKKLKDKEEKERTENAAIGTRHP